MALSRSTRRAVSIEEVFVQLSKWKAHNGPGALPKVPLSPRSAAACLREGVDPQDLTIRDIDAFWKPGVDPAVQRMRHEAYSALRHEKMKTVRLARRAIMKEEELAATASPTRGGGSTARSSSSDAKNLLELERRRLEKIKIKQQKEIESMMAYEMKLAKIAEEQERRKATERLRQEKMEREKMLRKKQAEELRRAKALKKKLMEEQEEQHRRQVIAKQREKELALAAEQKKKEEIMRREAREREEDRKRKQEEFKEKTAAILAAQQAEIQAKMIEMQEAEKIRQEQMEERNRQRQLEAERKRAETEARIEEARRQAEHIEQERKRAYREKMRRQAEKERLAAEERERTRQEQERQQLLEAHKRQLLLEATRREEELRKESLMAKQEEAAEILRKVEADKSREQALKRERRALIQEAKADKVERQRKRDEFYRMQTLEKLREKAERTEHMLTEKDKLLQERRELQLQVKKQRQVIMEAMETAKRKKDWKKAEATINMALSQTGGTSKSKSRTRGSRSLPDIRKSDDAPDAFDEQAARRAAKHYSDQAARVEAENARRRGSRGPEDSETDKASTYISPYELAKMEAKSRPIKATPVAAFAHVAGGAL